MSDPARALEVAIEAAQVGAKVTLGYFEALSAGDVTQKASAGGEAGGANLVTVADLESEKAIVACIQCHFPDHEFLGEEAHTAAANADHLWIIDPLDGTNNFAHGIAQFGVSVAYYQNGNPVCGAVINPATGDLFSAAVGQGAFRNGKRVSVNQHAALDQTIVCTGFYYDRGELMRSTLAAIEHLFGTGIHGIRRFGAASLDLCAVGAGQLGAYFEFTLSPWDFAAAAIFVHEAGGKATDCRGNPLTLTKTSLLSTNRRLHPDMMDALESFIPGSS